STLVSFYRLLPPPPPPSFPTRRSSDLSSTCAFIPQNHSFYHDPHQTLKINSRMLIESGIFRSYQGLNNVLWYRVKRYIETVLPVKTVKKHIINRVNLRCFHIAEKFDFIFRGHPSIRTKID